MARTPSQTPSYQNKLNKKKEYGKRTPEQRAKHNTALKEKRTAEKVKLKGQVLFTLGGREFGDCTTKSKALTSGVELRVKVRCSKAYNSPFYNPSLTLLKATAIQLDGISSKEARATSGFKEFGGDTALAKSKALSSVVELPVKVRCSKAFNSLIYQYFTLF